MEKTTSRLKRLFALLLVVLLLYTLCRIIFIFYNYVQLNINNFQLLLHLLWGGIRFDVSAIALFNLPVIVFLLMPVPFTTNKIYVGVIRWYFVMVNSLCLLANLIDVAYFPFVLKRAQSDALLFISGKKGNDLFRLLPSFFKEFWYLIIFWGLFIWTLWFSFSYTNRIKKMASATKLSYLYTSIAFLIISGLAVIAIRGGFQAKPLNLIHASEMTEVKNIPAILNTPFSIVRTLSKNYLEEKYYFSEKDLHRFKNGIHTPTPKAIFDKRNVVIIIVESLSKKHLSYFGGEAHTPFLDSLISKGYVFNNAFANGKESIQGIPAILSSIPSLQSNPFIFSPYASNKITSIANLLKAQGYQTSFFHGGFNGSMGFDSYANLAGFDRYYGQKEYGNDADYDGHWGIWDEPFLQFMAKKLSNTKQPFLSTVFTLNTHNPFLVPDQYKNIFNKHRLPFLNCVEYLDFALEKYFNTIKTQPWFKNTLFVITADHSAPNFEGEKSNAVDDYRIPILFFQPNNEQLQGASDIIANQIDILPSILYLMNYPSSFYSMGSNLFSENSEGYSVNFIGNTYQYVDSSYCYQFNGERGIGFYNWKKDSLLNHNLITDSRNSKIPHCDSMLKMFIQFFDESMIRNSMYIENKQ